jgi:hypothetical protein
MSTNAHKTTISAKPRLCVHRWCIPVPSPRRLGTA